MLFARKPLLLYLCVLLFIQVATGIASWRFVQSGTTDFRNFYADGYMVRTGRARQLYDYNAQIRLQSQVVTPRTGALPLMVPPFAALLLAPFSLLPYQAAFIVFGLFNLALIALAIASLRPFIASLAGYAYVAPILLFLSFPPLGFALVQGQLSIVLLALYCAAYAALRHHRPFLAGCLLSLALLKLQIAIPVALLFLLWRQWRFVAGFSLGSLLLISASVCTVGSNHLADIARSMLSTPAMLPTAAAQMKYGIAPQNMTNLYGLCYKLLGGGHLTLAATILSSVAVFVWAARKQASLPLALSVGLLVSYHLYIHDLTVLLLPYALLLNQYLRASESPAPQEPASRSPEVTTPIYTVTIACSLLIFPLTIFLIASGWQPLFNIPVLLTALALGARLSSQPCAPAMANHAVASA